jgi:phosphatidate cytidylyltransferase
MKTRIIVAVIFVPLLFIVLFFLPAIAITALVSAIAAIASFEFLKAAGAKDRMRLRIYAAVSAAIIPLSVWLGEGERIFRVILYLLTAVIFAEAVFAYKNENKITLGHVTATLFAGAVIPFFMSSLISLKLLEAGKFYVLIPFIAAFVTDGGAYFTGVFFGKHKAAPYVSPKKTIEGCVGGIMIGVAAMMLYGVILHLSVGYNVNFIAMILYGLLGGIVTELGDLAFSLIKREFGIKDYGSLIPGHGGMLDRFDSMVFAAPAIFILVNLLPAF